MYNIINFRSLHGRDDLVAEIEKIPYTNGESNAHLGLVKAASEFQRFSKRLGAAKYCLVMTDGRSTEPALTIREADRLHRYIHELR